MKFAAIFIVCFKFLIQFSFGAKGKTLPAYFPHCHRFDPKLSECLLQATKAMKPILEKGEPELGIPQFKEFAIPQITLEQGTNALNFKALLTDVKVSGLTNYTFSKFDFDVPRLFFTVQAKIGSISLNGKYKVTGKILLAPIEGSGHFVAQIDNCDVFLTEQCEIVERSGVQYLHPKETNTTIRVSGPKAHLEGLFGGNKELNDATNKAINDNVDDLFEELRPVIEKVVTQIITETLIKEILARVPWDNLYPPIK